MVEEQINEKEKNALIYDALTKDEDVQLAIKVRNGFGKLAVLELIEKSVVPKEEEKIVGRK